MIAYKKWVKKKQITSLEWCFSKGLVKCSVTHFWWGRWWWLCLLAPQLFAFPLSQRTTSPQRHPTSTLTWSWRGLCPTLVSTIILHLDILHLHFPFSTLILFWSLDLWFAIMDWSPAGNGNISFQRPRPTLAFQKVFISTISQKQNWENISWIACFIPVWIFVFLPTLIWDFTVPLAVPAPLVGLLRAPIRHTNDVMSPHPFWCRLCWCLCTSLSSCCFLQPFGV